MKKTLFNALLVCVAALALWTATGKAQAAVSDGKEKIAFVSDRDGNNEIYITNADGTGTPLNLSNNAADDINPCISPDGNKILWSSNRNGANHDIYEANTDGTNPVRLTTVGDSLQPTYSPDGQKIAFASNLDGSLYNVWIINHDLSNLLKLTNRSFSSYHPSFSPSGQQVTFYSSVTYTYTTTGGRPPRPHTVTRTVPEIFKINIDSSGQQQLTSHGSSSALSSLNPSWGVLDKIAYTFASDIYTMDTNGASQTNITNNAAVDTDPAWGPDGQQIAFTSNRDGNNEIYITNPDNTGTPIRLTNNAASDSTPSWGPPTNGPFSHALRVSNVSVVEGSAQGATASVTNAVFKVTLYPAQTSDVTVHYATEGGTAAPGADYTAQQGDLHFNAGETAQTVSVPVIGDALNEDNETFNLTLSNPVNAAIARAQGVATITDDDPLPTLAIDNQSKAEGNTGTSVMTFHATLSAPSGRTVTVKYSTTGITADSSDYVPASGTLTFPPGTVSQNIPITIKGDTTAEDDETFAVTLSDPTNVVTQIFNSSNNHYYEMVVAGVDWDTAKAAAEAKTLGGVKGHLVTITSADEQAFLNSQFPAYAYFTGGVRTGNSTDANGGFTWLTGEPFTYSNWHAGEPNGTVTGDVIHTYEAATGYGGQWNDTAHTEAVNGYVIEYDTTAPVSIGIGTILNDDYAPTLNIKDVSVVEGSAQGTSAIAANAIFTVSLYGTHPNDVTVNYATGGGTATPGTDYTAQQGTLVFHASDTTKTISVPVIGDALNEDNETFNLVLSNPVNATTARAQGVATITDDDPLPTLAIDNQSKAEGNTGTSVMTFHATLSAPSGRTVTVKYSTTGITADSSDYVPASGTLTFPPGTVSQNIPITIKGDTTAEDDETFAVTLSDLTNTVVPTSPQIFNSSNNHYYEMVVAGVDWDTAKAAAEAKTLGGVKGHLVTITSADEQAFLNSQFPAYAYFTGGVRTGNSTDANGGFTWLTGEPFTYSNWHAGEPNGTVTGDVIHTYEAATGYGGQWNDTAHTEAVNGYVIEYDTTAPVSIGIGIGTILNDDPALSVSDVALVEGNSATTNAIFTVSFHAVHSNDVTVSYAAGGGTATPGTDYTAQQGTLVFHAGETSKTISVPVVGDLLNEDNETFNLTLSNPVNAAIARAQGTATITDDDPLPIISIDNQSKAEGNTGTSVMTFHVTLSTPSGRTVTVKYSTTDITADSSDYVPASGTLTFPPGTVSQNIPITIKGDTTAENDETFAVTLSDLTNTVVPTSLTPSQIFNSSNNHYYEMVVAGVDWDTAKAAAEAKTLGGVKGHLVTITSAAEQAFLTEHFSAPNYFTGGVQTAGSAEPAGGFTWVTGEPFTYSNWSQGEPNNAFDNFNEDVIGVYGANAYGSPGTWNDVKRDGTSGSIGGYVIEYDTTSAVGVNVGRGTILNDDGPVPSPWNAADLAVGSDNLARLLWQRPDKAFALWTLSSSNTIQSTPLYGPITGWGCTRMAIGGDGKIRPLLNNINGASAVWTVQNPTTGSITSTPAYGPYSGFTCREIAAAPGNTTRLLWVRSDGAFAIWTVDGGGSFTSTPLFGPIAGWSANAISVGGDNKTTILLNGPDNRAAVWTVQNASTGAFTSTPAYGPITGFACRDIATGSDNKTRMLWVRSDGAFAIWTADATATANNYSSTPLYGPIAGWSGIKIGVGGDLKTRVLLTNTDGRAVVWTIEGNGSFTSTPAYGPIAYQPK